MKIRLANKVWIRSEDFGGVAYVHHRNDFFFLDEPSFKLVAQLSTEWRLCAQEKIDAYRKLAQIGICETASPTTREKNYSGPSFVGIFSAPPKVARPLVLNCFATAFCPLLCRYCHADDLMKPFRSTEEPTQLKSVIETAKKADAMVLVISGGDPLTRVDRAIALIEGIGSRKPMVIDTSGVPSSSNDLNRLLPYLSKYDVHVRVSIDGFQSDNDKMRPVNRKEAPAARSSYEEATRSLQTFLRAGLSVSVQTVLSTQNDRADNLIQFAHQLETWGVKNWVIHIAAAAGKAREESPRPIIPNKDCFPVLKRVLKDSNELGLRLDIRVTNANPNRNAVFLVGSEGDLYTEGFETPGKVLIVSRNDFRTSTDIWKHVNPQAHVVRYSNWIKELYPKKSIEDVSMNLFSGKNVRNGPDNGSIRLRYRAIP